MMRERPFEAGERVLLIDHRGRRYMVNLVTGGQFHSHLGALAHDDVIGQPEGVLVQATAGSRLLAFRPTLADYLLKMRRGAQVIYPKDIGLLLIHADIYPGASVLEAGTGSGALTLALARAVGATGRVVSYELRDDHHEQAVRNIEAWYEGTGTKPENIELRVGDVFGGIDDVGFDRMVFDLPEPWHFVDKTAASLRSGGVVCCYLPTVPQVSTTVDALRSAGFGLVNTFEALVRTWNVEGQSVRPDHRMVAHTGFLITARKLESRQVDTAT